MKIPSLNHWTTKKVFYIINVLHKLKSGQYFTIWINATYDKCYLIVRELCCFQLSN